MKHQTHMQTSICISYQHPYMVAESRGQFKHALLTPTITHVLGQTHSRKCFLSPDTDPTIYSLIPQPIYYQTYY